MSYETVALERRDRVGILTLNRPEKFNTFSSRLARELNQGLRELDQEDTISVVIVKGQGKAFSTGIDLAEFPGKSREEYKEWISLMDEMHLTVASMKKPVIAMVHGYAVANGAGLLAAADFAIVAEGTKVGTTAINVGLLCTGPIIPMSYGIGKEEGSGNAAERRHDRRRRSGKARTGEQGARPKSWKKKPWLSPGNSSPRALAVKLGKQFYYETMDLPFRQRFEHSSNVFADLCSSEDAREGVDAFASKRKPNWKGR